MLSKGPYIKKSYCIILTIFCSILLVILYSPAVVPAEKKEEINYCNDEESWKEWDDLAVKYPNDEDIIILHSLRLGLCVKVKRGVITVQQATDIFEKMRTIIIERKKDTMKKDKGVL